MASGFAHTYWWAMAITALALVPALVLARAQRSEAGQRAGPGADRRLAGRASARCQACDARGEPLLVGLDRARGRLERARGRRARMAAARVK